MRTGMFSLANEKKKGGGIQEIFELAESCIIGLNMFCYVPKKAGCGSFARFTQTF